MLKTRRTRPADDSQSGVALMTAIMVIAVGGLLAVVVSSLAFHNQNTTQLDRSRTQAIGAAEAGVDSGTLQVKQPVLPCTAAGTLDTEPTESSYDVEFVYYQTYPVTSAPLTCTTAGVFSGTTRVTPQAVLIRSTGNASTRADRGLRTMEVLARLTPVPGNDFNKAIYAAGSLNITNRAIINGNVGNDGDLYTNQPFNCSNSLEVHGSVYTQGTATMSNTCAVLNDLYAKGNVSLGVGAGMSVGRDVKSSQGNIDFPRGTITRDAIASGTVIAPSARSRIAGATIPDPPTEAFPELPWNDPATPNFWNTGVDPFQFTNVIRNNTCTAAGVYGAIAGLSSAGPDTIVYTTCSLSWANNTNISFGRNVVIYARGFTTNNNFTMRSNTAGTKRRLYWVVPSNAVASRPCSTNNITTSNRTMFTDLEVFFYSPCNVSVANLSVTKGQVYSGSNVTIANNFELTYVPLPVTGLLTSTALPIGYRVDLVYKRETTSEQTTTTTTTTPAS